MDILDDMGVSKLLFCEVYFCRSPRLSLL